MTSASASLKKDVIVVNELGLHARSAAKVAKAARQATGRVWLARESECVDAKQVIDMLALGAAQGDRLRIAVESSDDTEVLNTIVALFEKGFGE